MLLCRRLLDVSSWRTVLLLTISLIVVPRNNIEKTFCHAFGFTMPSTRTPTFQKTTSNNNAISISTTTPRNNNRLLTKLHDKKSDNDEDNDDDDDPIKEAQRLLDRARQIRESLATIDNASSSSSSETRGVSSSLSTITNTISSSSQSSPFTIPTTDQNNNSNSTPPIGYRLYLNIGREKNTWMDPRWGATGSRIELSIDIQFLTTDERAAAEIVDGMVTDNFGGRSSAVYVVRTAPYARLRGGFDKMKCYAGGYRFDVDDNDKSRRKKTRTTVRFYVGVEGTPPTKEESTYGDVSIPKGGLYFSIPCFGPVGDVSNLSTKEYPVTVRMMGWNTGWWRMESRMVGVYRAVPIEQARRRDKF